MFIKIFTSDEEANAFIPTVELLEQNAIHYTDGKIVVFYRGPKETTHSRAITERIDLIKHNIFIEKLRKATITSELEVFKDNPERTQETEERIKKSQEDIDLMEAKLQALTNLI
jgi:stress response protein YsnF